MDAVSSDGESYVRARINEQASFWLLISRFSMANGLERLMGEGLEFAGRQVFFAKLDEIDPAGCGF
jgi:hypothetical protein